MPPIAPTDAPTLESAPVSKPLSLDPGSYWLQIYGRGRSGDPAEPVCTPPYQPPLGTFVNTAVRLERTALGWVARSAAANGTLELGLVQTGTATIRGEVLTGTVRGMAADRSPGSYRPATNVSVALSGAPGDWATVRGIASAGATFLSGDITGRIAFSDPSGLSSTCALVYWTLQPDAAG
jgi:hypothetical protein